MRLYEEELQMINKNNTISTGNHCFLFHLFIWILTEWMVFIIQDYINKMMIYSQISKLVKKELVGKKVFIEDKSEIMKCSKEINNNNCWDFLPKINSEIILYKIEESHQNNRKKKFIGSIVRIKMIETPSYIYVCGIKLSFFAINNKSLLMKMETKELIIPIISPRNFKKLNKPRNFVVQINKMNINLPNCQPYLLCQDDQMEKVNFMFTMKYFNTENGIQKIFWRNFNDTIFCKRSQLPSICDARSKGVPFQFSTAIANNYKTLPLPSTSSPPLSSIISRSNELFVNNQNKKNHKKDIQFIKPIYKLTGLPSAIVPTECPKDKKRVQIQAIDELLDGGKISFNKTKKYKRRRRKSKATNEKAKKIKKQKRNNKRLNNRQKGYQRITKKIPLISSGHISYGAGVNRTCHSSEYGRKRGEGRHSSNNGGSSSGGSSSGSGKSSSSNGKSGCSNSGSGISGSSNGASSSSGASGNGSSNNGGKRNNDDQMRKGTSSSVNDTAGSIENQRVSANLEDSPEVTLCNFLSDLDNFQSSPILWSTNIPMIQDDDISASIRRIDDVLTVISLKNSSSSQAVIEHRMDSRNRNEREILFSEESREYHTESIPIPEEEIYQNNPELVNYSNNYDNNITTEEVHSLRVNEQVDEVLVAIPESDVILLFIPQREGVVEVFDDVVVAEEEEMNF